MNAQQQRPLRLSAALFALAMLVPGVLRAQPVATTTWRDVPLTVTGGSVTLDVYITWDGDDYSSQVEANSVPGGIRITDSGSTEVARFNVSIPDRFGPSPAAVTAGSLANQSYYYWFKVGVHATAAWFRVQWTIPLPNGSYTMALRDGQAWDNSKNATTIWTVSEATPIVTNPGVTVTAKVSKAASVDWVDGITVFPHFDAATSPNRFPYDGEPWKIQVTATDMGSRIDKIGYMILPSIRFFADTPPTGSIQQIFDQTALSVSDSIAIVGRVELGSDGTQDSTGVSVASYNLEPIPLDLLPATEKLDSWAEAPSGAPGKPWEIARDYHHLNGQTEANTDYGLEFNTHQYLRQSWQWVDPATGVVQNVIGTVYNEPREAIAQLDAPAPGAFGPLFQRERTRWAPGLRPVTPVAHPVNVELNVGDTMSAIAISWNNPWSVTERPDSWDQWPNYHAAEIRRAAFNPPSGTTTLSVVRAEDAYNLGTVTTGQALPAGTWQVTATYTPALGEFYNATSVSFTITVNPKVTVTTSNASVEYSGDGGSTWAPWPATASFWQRSDTSWRIFDGVGVTTFPSLRLRAAPATNYAWGTDWSGAGPMWSFTGSTGPTDTPANFWMPPESGTNPMEITIPRAINVTTCVATGRQIPPRITWLTIDDVPGRCASIGMSSPWAFLARPGVQFVVRGQSRESGIDSFQVQALPPGADEAVDANWQDLGTFAASVASGPMEILEHKPSVKIGKTRADDGDVGVGATFIPSEARMALLDQAALPPYTVNWRIRARCRAIVGTWSSWQLFTVGMMLPLCSEQITTQTVAPALPAGASLWVRSSDQVTERVYIWLP